MNKIAKEDVDKVFELLMKRYKAGAISEQMMQAYEVFVNHVRFKHVLVKDCRITEHEEMFWDIYLKVK